jgi:hypothetical protein
MAQNPLFVGTIKTPVAQIQNSDGTNAVTFFTAGVSGSKLEAIAATSTDTSAVVVQAIVTVSAVDYVIGEINIPAGAGTNGTADSVRIMNITDLPWLCGDGVNQVLLLASGVPLKFKAKTTVTAGKVLQFFGQGGDF